MSKTDNPTRISVILDRSGSMMFMQAEVIGGFNQFVKDQREVPGKTRWTLMQFDKHETVADLNYVYADVRGRDVPELTMLTYQPRGATPLLDAVGTELARLLMETDLKTVVYIITDGYENASTEFTKPRVQDLVKRAEDLGWQVIFMAANIDAAGEAAFIGSTRGHTISTDGLTMTVAYAAAGQSVADYRTTGEVTTKDDDTKESE